MTRAELVAMDIRDYMEVVEAFGEKMKREIRRDL